MQRRFSLTLGQVFLLTLLGLTILLGLLFYVLLHGSQQSLLTSANLLRVEMGARLGDQVAAFCNQAVDVADNVEREFQHGLIHADDRDAVESALYAQVLSHPDIAEVTFTHAVSTGLSDFHLVFADDNRWQISVFRGGDGADLDWIIRRRVTQAGKTFQAQTSDPHSPAAAWTAPDTQPAVSDPVMNDTFQGTTWLAQLKVPLWSDLHWSELTSASPQPRQRAEVTVQKTVYDGDTFLGVVRVGLLEMQVNKIVRPTELSGDDLIARSPPTCFLCDPQGRLITPVTPQDQLAVDGDDIRIHSSAMPAEVAAALAMKQLPSIQNAPIGGAINVGGRRYLVTFLKVTAQDWILGVVQSQDSILGSLIGTQRQVLMGSALVMATILLCGIFTLRVVRRGLTRIMGTTSRMREFDFAPAASVSTFRDVQAVMESLEQAKTAMRAMGKYVPMDLVRNLYHMNREPVLGGEMRELSILFTDIEGFTSLSETLSPDRLAMALGHYLQVMTLAIHEQKGTIDKFIGDSVMAIWNAPLICDGHAVKACAAALACDRATQRLFASPDWQGLPPLVTRCGLHRDVVMVGHFGAPDRMSYTALGDGVNLASRLEGLNKYYGTRIIVSQTIHEQAAGKFQFRLLDRVAVKGKTHAVQVYELLANAEDAQVQGDVVKVYESALRAYWNRDFAGALGIFEKQPNDPPSRILAERCRHLMEEPPPVNWAGEYISTMK